MIPNRLGFSLCLLLSAAGIAAVHALPDAFLKADGQTLRDRAGTGEIMRLRGFNLGNWFYQEDWMTPSHKNDPANPGKTVGLYEAEIHEILTARFGVTVKNQLVDGYRRAWMSTLDLDNLAAHGVNLVRVPFTFLNFMEPDGTWRADADAFDRLDWIITEAGARGIYCILDFHYPQGGTGSGPFWSTTLYQDRATAIWSKVAARYAGNPWVAAYDLLNEPLGASNTAQWDVVDRFYRAVRAVDPDHAVAVEAVWDLDALPRTDLYGWTNVIYSLHWYGWNKDESQLLSMVDSDLAKLDANTALGAAGGKFVPINIGEFSYWHYPNVWRYALPRFQARGLSWTIWSYKSRDNGTWSLYNTNRPIVNLSTATPEEIATAWQAHATASLSDGHNSYLRDLVASPIANHDALTVPAGGNLVIPHAALLANDTTLNSAPSLVVLTPSSPSAGDLHVLDAATLLYAPAPGQAPGPVTFRYRPLDQSNGLDSAHFATVTLNVSAAPAVPVPYAAPDAYAVRAGSVSRIPSPGVLANDGDLSGRTLSAELVSAPASGTLALHSSGAFSYTPAAGFTGETSFSYRPRTTEGATGAAVTVKLRIAAPPPLAPNGLQAAYYPTTNWTGSAATRLDAALDFTWASDEAPISGVSAGPYSVRWTGWIHPPYSGLYTFTATLDDAAGVYVNGTAVLEEWSGGAPRDRSGTVQLTAGTPAYLQVDFINYGGGARAALAWSHDLIAKQIIPSARLTPGTASWPAPDDLDGNARSDLLDYALGGNPAAGIPAPANWTGTIVDNRLTLTFNRARIELDYFVEVSSDLAIWNTLATNPGSVGQSVTVTDTVSVPSANPPQRFMRLRVLSP